MSTNTTSTAVAAATCPAWCTMGQEGGAHPRPADRDGITHLARMYGNHLQPWDALEVIERDARRAGGWLFDRRVEIEDSARADEPEEARWYDTVDNPPCAPWCETEHHPLEFAASSGLLCTKKIAQSHDFVVALERSQCAQNEPGAINVEDVIYFTSDLEGHTTIDHTPTAERVLALADALRTASHELAAYQAHETTLGRYSKAMGEHLAVLRGERTATAVAEKMRKYGFPWGEQTVASTESGTRPLLIAEMPALAEILGVGLVELLPAEPVQDLPWWMSAANPPCSPWCTDEHDPDEFKRPGSGMIACSKTIITNDVLTVVLRQIHTETGEPNQVDSLTPDLHFYSTLIDQDGFCIPVESIPRISGGVVAAVREATQVLTEVPA